MRIHIGLTISHFLLLTVSITEDQRNKNLGETGIHSSVPCRDSILEQFLYYRVAQKMQNVISFRTLAITPVLPIFFSDLSNAHSQK